MEIPSFESYFTVIRNFAYFIGLELFRPNPERRCFNYAMNIYGVLTTANQIFYQTCFTIFLILYASDAIEIIEHIPFIIFCLESILRCFFMRYYRDEITDLVEEFRKLYSLPWKYNEKLVQELHESRRNFVRVQYFYLVCNIIFCAGAILVSLFIYFILHSMDLMFIVNTWLPFDRYKYAWIVFILDTNTARYAQYGNTVPDGILIMLIIQLNYHFENLGHTIQDIVKDLNNKDKDQKQKENKIKFMSTLKEAAYLHNKLTKLSEQLNNTFSILIFGKFMSASIIICCTGFITMFSDDYILISQFLMFLMVMLMQPFILSIYGKLHSEKSELVGELAYNSEWYNCKNADMKTIKFIIMRAQRPCFITIYRFTNVSRETFKEIVTAAYQFLALLKNMYE